MNQRVEREKERVGEGGCEGGGWHEGSHISSTLIFHDIQPACRAVCKLCVVFPSRLDARPLSRPRLGDSIDSTLLPDR